MVIHPPKRNDKILRREAVRAIIIDGNRLLMIYSRIDGCYKFPGGGIEPKETWSEALVREVSEEGGAIISKIGRPFHRVVEYAEPREAECDLFEMTSTYYLCAIKEDLESQQLDEYEQTLGFTPKWVDIDVVIAVNRLALNKPQSPRWIEREACVLAEIKEYLFSRNREPDFRTTVIHRRPVSRDSE